MTAFLLVIIGALNWGLIGLFNFNLVMALLGAWPMLEAIIYILVGLSAIYLVVMHKRDCMTCSMPMAKPMAAKATSVRTTKSKSRRSK